MSSSLSKNRYLITTADERTWVMDRPVLFLGEWCKRYSRRNKWLLLDSMSLNALAGVMVFQTKH